MGFISKRGRLSIVYFVVMCCLGILQISFSAVNTTLSDNIMDITYTLVSQCLCMGLVPFLLTLWLKPCKKGESRVKNLFRDFGYRKPISKKCWWLLIPICISLYLLTSLSSRIWNLFLMVIGFDNPTFGGYLFSKPWDLPLWIFMVGVLPAVFEEFTHRGLLFDMLEDRGNEWEIVFFSALLFAGMHTNINQFGYAFVGGLVMGFVALRTGSIYFSMATHFFTNFISVMSNYASQDLGILGKISDALDGFFMTPLGIGATFVILMANLVLLYLILGAFEKYDTREKVRPKPFLPPKIFLDSYKKDGKATLKDNAFIIGSICIGISVTLFTLLFGYFR